MMCGLGWSIYSSMSGVFAVHEVGGAGAMES